MKRHYEKIIVVCCFLTTFTNIGLASSSFNVYQPYIVAIPGVGDAGGSLVLACRTLASLICMFFVGKYYRVLDCRRGIGIASLLVVAGFVVYAAADSTAVLCAGAVLTGAGYGLGGMVATTMLIGRWFKGHLGTALGIVAVGSGVAAMVVPTCVTAVIQAFSLQWAFFMEACLALLLDAAIVVLLRNRPEDVGLAPFEGTPARGAVKNQAGPAEPLPSRLMTLMLVGMFFLGCTGVGGANYFGVLLHSVGLDAMQVAFCLSLMGACLTVAKAVNGVVFDKIGTSAGSAIFFLLMIAGLAACCFTGQVGYLAALTAAVLFGAGVALATVGISMWSLELAPVLQRARVIKNFQIAYATGGFACNLFPGLLADLTGSYVVSYAVFLLMAAACMGIVLHVYVRRPGRV
ncbi:MAG: MFS transporter [Coriobacteriia bacterium]|nr:MFS transporter [Coriobacteriia bacterium]